MFHAQAFARVDGDGAVDVQPHGVPDHHVGQLLRVGVARFDVADVLAFAKDGHAVGDLHDLV